MTGYKDSLSCVEQKDSPHKAMLGNDSLYPIKRMDSRKSMKMKDVLYVLGLKKNLLYSSALDKKGFKVAFVDGEFLMWIKWKTIYDVVVI